MEIREQIPILIELQKVDAEIYKFERRKLAIPIMIKKLEDGFKEKGEKLKQEDAAMKALLVKQKEKENELASKEETIKKCQGQLYQIKTNKEYTAMQHEIDGYGADKSVIEDDILGILDQVEEKKKDVEACKVQLKEDEKVLGQEKEKVNVELKKIEAGLASFNTMRQELLPKIDKSMVSKYERILKGKDGLAMVPVRHDSCGGCHLNLPPQVINEISMKKELIFCESCARILYIEE